MKKIFSRMLVMALAAFTATSCLNTSDSTEAHRTLTYGGGQCFNYVTDLLTGDGFISTMPNYTADVDEINLKAVLSISNLQLVQGSSNASFKLIDVPVTVGSNDFSYRLKGTGLTPVTNSTQYRFDDLQFTFADRYLTVDGAYEPSPFYNMSFTVVNGSDSYLVTVIPTSTYVVGTVTSEPVVASEDATAYSSPSMILGYTLNPATMKADVVILNARFAELMATSYIKIEGVPFTVSSAGPRIASVPGETYKIKDGAGVEYTDCTIDNLLVSTLLPSGTTTFVLQADLKGLQESPVLTPFLATGYFHYFAAPTE